MSNNGVKRKVAATAAAAADDDVSNTKLSDLNEKNQQIPLFQRPGPACWKKRSLEKYGNNQSPAKATCSMNSPSLVPQEAENSPEDPSQNSEDELESTYDEENDRDRSVSPPPISVSTFSRSSLPYVQNGDENQLGQPFQNSSSESEIKMDDELKFIMLVRKYPNLYNMTDPFYRDRGKKKKSWSAISRELGVTVNACRTRWKYIREKFCRVQKRLAEEDDVPEKITEFVNNMNFLSYRQRSITQRKNISRKNTLSVSPLMTRQKSKSVTRPVPVPTPSPIVDHTSNLEQSQTQDESIRPAQLFADAIALELRRFSPLEQNLIKAKMWQVIAEFGNRA